MAYRGSSRNPPVSKKPTSFSNSNLSGFETQFSDLAEYSACPPKRQRTNTGSKQNFNNAAKSKTPLKFDFRSSRGVEKIVPPAGPSFTSNNQRYVSKPVLPSQAKPQVAPEPTPTLGVSQDDWGDDGDDALLLAASQMAEPESNKIDDAELLAMTAMLEDDDFGLDDVACLEAAVIEADEEERLNQTVTVFNCNPTQFPSSQIFKPPQTLKPPPVKNQNIELIRSKEEQERLKKLNMKAQGEVSFLRAELLKHSKEIESERLSKKKLETELMGKLESEKRLQENEISTMKTEKLFLLQEMQQLQSKLKQIESDRKRETSSKGRKVLGQLNVDKGEFPTVNEFTVKETRVPIHDAETQTNHPKKRKSKLKRVMSLKLTMVHSLCKVSKLTDDIKSTILQESCEIGISRLINKTVAQLTKNVKENLLNGVPPSEVELFNLDSLINSCSLLLSSESRMAVTEICSNLFSWMTKTGKCSMLSSTLCLLVRIWSLGLLDQDITAYVLSLLQEVFRTIKSISEQITPSLITSIFTVLSLVSSDHQQASLLCKQSQDCFLSSICLVLHMSVKEDTVKISACKELVKWLLECSTVKYTLPWMGNSCPWCTGDIVRALTLVIQSVVCCYVDKSKDQTQTDSNEITLLKDSVSALARLQDNLRSDTGEDCVWIKIFDVFASVQRKYMWTTERLLRVEFEESTVSKLHSLHMETESEKDSMDIDS